MSTIRVSLNGRRRWHCVWQAAIDWKQKKYCFNPLRFLMGPILKYWKTAFISFKYLIDAVKPFLTLITRCVIVHIVNTNKYLHNVVRKLQFPLFTDCIYHKSPKDIIYNLPTYPVYCLAWKTISNKDNHITNSDFPFICKLNGKLWKANLDLALFAEI